MEVEELVDGLWRWTGRLASGEDVGSVYYEQDDRVYLIDPIVPPEDRERFLRALDRDMARFGGCGEVLLTSERHRRDAGAVLARYTEMQVVDAPTAHDVELISVGLDEVMYLLTRKATLVVGDALVGTGDGLAFGETPAPDVFRPLLGREIERVLVSHGEPVRTGGAQALRALVEGAG